VAQNRSDLMDDFTLPQGGLRYVPLMQVRTPSAAKNLTPQFELAVADEEILSTSNVLGNSSKHECLISNTNSDLI